MSLEAWGDEGMDGPEGYVTEEAFDEAQAEIKSLLAALGALVEASGNHIKATDLIALDLSAMRTKAAMLRALKLGKDTISDHTPWEGDPITLDECAARGRRYATSGIMLSFIRDDLCDLADVLGADHWIEKRRLEIVEGVEPKK